MRKLLVAAAALLVALLSWTWVGPFVSGAWLMSLPTGIPAREHDLPDSYEPLDKGHVTLVTGHYVREVDDLVVRGTPALVLRRAYVSGDPTMRQFGMGATHYGEEYLAGDPDRFQWAVLVLPDGTWVRFQRMSPGTSYQNAVFEHRESASEWQGARLGWTGTGWTLRRLDGHLMRFLGCVAGGPHPCSLVWERDADGHVIQYRRDARGRLLRMEAAPDRWIAFDYDARGRITRASAADGRHARYEYDAEGRLVHVLSGDGAEHHYRYSDRHEMTAISGSGIDIENTYDADGRCIKQVNRYPDSEPYVYRFGYLVDAGAVVQTDVSESDGSWTRYTYDRAMFVTAEAWGAVGLQPATLTYERDPATRSITGMTLTCPDRNGSLLPHYSGVRNGNDEWIKWDLLRTNCSWQIDDWREPN